MGGVLVRLDGRDQYPKSALAKRQKTWPLRRSRARKLDLVEFADKGPAVCSLRILGLVEQDDAAAPVAPSERHVPGAIGAHDDMGIAESPLVIGEFGWPRIDDGFRRRCVEQI